MGNQIVLTVDPLTTANPFFGSAAITEWCMNSSEWIYQHQAFHQTAMQFGYFCLVVGAFVGFISGYYYAKRKYGDL